MQAGTEQKKMVVSLKAMALPNLMIQPTFLVALILLRVRGEQPDAGEREKERETEKDRERHEPTVDTTLSTLEWKKKTEAVYRPRSLDR